MLVCHFYVFQTIQKVNSDHRFDVEGFQYEVIREDRYDDMLDLYMCHFFPDEPLSRAVGVVVDDELRMFMLAAIQQNLSVALVSCETQEIIGGRIIEVANRDDNHDISLLKLEPNRICVDVMAEMDRRCNVFDYYNVNDIINFFGLVVHRNYRQRGISEKLMRAAVFFVQNLGLGHVIIKGGGTSSFSQRLYEKIGFETLAEVVYAEYTVDGKVVVSNTGEHKSERLYGWSIN